MNYHEHAAKIQAESDEYFKRLDSYPHDYPWWKIVNEELERKHGERTKGWFAPGPIRW